MVPCLQRAFGAVRGLHCAECPSKACGSTITPIASAAGGAARGFFRRCSNGWEKSRSRQLCHWPIFTAWPPRAFFSIPLVGEKLPEFIDRLQSAGNLQLFTDSANSRSLSAAFTLAFDAQTSKALSLQAFQWFRLKGLGFIQGSLDSICQMAAIASTHPWRLCKVAKSWGICFPLPPTAGNRDCLVFLLITSVCQYRSLEPEEASALRFSSRVDRSPKLCEFI